MPIIKINRVKEEKKMKSILDKMKIGNLEVDGRIIMPPMGTYKCDTEGNVTDDVLEYYKLRAKNLHIGLIITEHAYIDKRGKAKENQMSIADDSNIEGLRKLVKVIHDEGVKVFAQLNFGGSASPRKVCGCEQYAPSAIILPATPQTGDDIPPKEMTKEEIKEITECFVSAAKRAKSAGYDGIEIHSAHAYLLNQFYSPLTNKRTDEYGGSLENRLRFLCEVLHAVRNAVGEEYPISLRLGGYDDAEGGNVLADCVEAAKILEKENIQLLSLTGGMCRYIRKGHNEPGYFRDMSEAIKNATDIPVLLTGGIKTLEEAVKLVEEDATDFVGVGRPLLANAEWMMDI